MNIMHNLEKWNNKVLFKKITEILEKKFGDLPREGVISGQSVASALYEVIGLPVQGRYKDLDVFEKKTEYVNKYDKEGMGVGLSRSHISGGKTMLDSFGDQLETGAFPKSSYQITDTYMDIDNDLINHIKIWSDNINDVNMADIIIKSFDINAVQVAIDPAAKTVSWTPEFQEFLHTRELKSTWCGTPLHTSVRLLNKEMEMSNVFLNEKLELHRLQTIKAIINDYQDDIQKFIPGNLFASAYQERYAKLEEKLSKYWNKEDVTIIRQNYDDNDNLVQSAVSFLTLNPKNSCQRTRDFAERNRRVLCQSTPIEDAYNVFSRVYDVFNNTSSPNPVMARYFNLLDTQKLYQSRDPNVRAKIQLAVEFCYNKSMNFTSQKEMDDFTEKYIVAYYYNSKILNELSGKSKEQIVNAVENLNDAIKTDKVPFLNHVMKRAISLDTVAEMSIEQCEQFNTNLLTMLGEQKINPILGNLTDIDINNPDLFDDIIYTHSNANTQVKVTELTSEVESFFANDVMHGSFEMEEGYESWTKIRDREEFMFKISSEVHGRKYDSLLVITPYCSMTEDTSKPQKMNLEDFYEISSIGKIEFNGAGNVDDNYPRFDFAVHHDFDKYHQEEVAKNHELAAHKITDILDKKAYSYKSVMSMLESVASELDTPALNRIKQKESAYENNQKRNDMIPF